MDHEIWSLYRIIEWLEIQANLRSPENDVGGLLKDCADVLRDEMEDH